VQHVGQSKSSSFPPLDAHLSAAEIRRALVQLASRNGPAVEDYPLCRDVMDSISALRANGVISEAENDALWELVGEASTTKTLMGFIYRKPHGYHGDFEIIERFYTGHVSREPHLTRWDSWIQSLEATRAVRNRKEFFKRLVADLPSGKRARILSVGSGPCCDIREALDLTAGQHEVVCVDLDQRAIDYARSVLSGHADRVQFIQKNVLRMDFVGEFDLVWSAGLFDYLEDRLFVAALKRMYRAARAGGRIVIGNFSLQNPSRSAMEWGNWRLIYRSADELLKLVRQADLQAATVEVEAEPLGVNLFVSILKR
jgi:extracellular factor (EF) 3-hydroxypalmitic acid methyl ester biosynthesis protein